MSDEDKMLGFQDVVLPAIFTVCGLMLINPDVTIAGCFGIILVFIAAFMVAVKILVKQCEANEEERNDGN